MPPLSGNHREPTAGDTPLRIAACSLDRPSAIAAQNRSRCSPRHRWAPGERIGALPVLAATHPGRRPMRIPLIEVLRRPLESAQYLAIRYTERLAEIGAIGSVGSVGDSYDDAAAESLIGLLKTELIRRRRPWAGAVQPVPRPHQPLLPPSRRPFMIERSTAGVLGVPSPYGRTRMIVFPLTR